MLGVKDEWQILKTGKRKDFLLIAAITVIFLLVVVLNITFVFNLLAHQTEDLGQMQLENIRSELQGTLDDAERMTLRVAVSAEQMLTSGASQDEFKKFLMHEQREQKILSDGVCFNVYMANPDWIILPEGSLPEDYHAVDRNWYKGAMNNPGKVFISEPHVDAAGHGHCFTVSMMLSDSRTVIALDFNFGGMQASIDKLDIGNDRMALITTSEGMIIACVNEKFIGENIRERLPAYQRTLDTVLSSKTHDSFQTKIESQPNTVFFSMTNNGWYVLLCVADSSLYRDDYLHLLLTTSVNLWMILVIVFYYLKSMKNRLQAQKALHVKEEFLARLSKELHAPLQQILKLSKQASSGNDDSPSESARKAHEQALRLSEMINNLLSFSTITKKDDFNLDEKADKNLRLSEVSRTARLRIIAVLTIALIFRVGISIHTNIGWGDTMMSRQLEAYDYRLSNWVVEQKSILSMFVNVFATHPHLIQNYPDAVKFLNDLASKYPQIAACYLANPDNPHQFISNTGWKSNNPSWRLEKLDWYIETEKSNSPFTVLNPYFDSRSGSYCVTMAQSVYSSDGKFLGIFAIDFYLDRLISFLDDSYNDNDYAFIVDRRGKIINHPHADYQMSSDNMIDVTLTEFKSVYESGEDFFMRDFSGSFMTCIALKNIPSGFTVIVADNWFNTYGQVIYFAATFIIIYIIGISLVIALINQLLRWQTEVYKDIEAASDKAKAASQAKSQFLAQMSHEIRTPINAVLGMNEMILRESTDRDILEYSENISSAGRTLLNLINSILDFSKIEEGKMEIIPVRYDTLNLIDDLVNMIYDKANKKKLSLITRIDPNLPKSLYGDDMRIKQVITNILSNAVKYTEEGTITLTMSGEVVDEENLMLYVSVEDTGIGIREEDIDKLFQSFIRLDEKKNKNIEGTGLGISIVKELLHMMNSRLEVSSVYGKGSKFSFKLPQKIIDKGAIGFYGEHHAERKFRRVENKKFIKAPGARVLAVDDTAMNLKVINGLLKRNQIVPDLADSGERCLQLAKKYFYNIIFLDHMMPKMNGVETLKRLKELTLPAETKIIVLTANAISGSRERYLTLGFDDYLSKPINVDRLEAILAKYLPPELIHDEEDDEEPPIISERILLEEPTPKEPESLIDMEVALSSCANSKELLTELVEEFINSDKTAELEEELKALDLDNYRITAHALKGTSKLFGATELSDKAKAQEFAARDGRLDDVAANHADLVETYKRVLDELGKWLEEKR